MHKISNLAISVHIIMYSLYENVVTFIHGIYKDMYGNGKIAHFVNLRFVWCCHMIQALGGKTVFSR